MSDYPNQWRSNREKLFTSFLRGIENWSRTGQEPKEGDQDVRYYLDLQEHRLKDRRITMEYRFPQGSLPVTQAGKVLGGAVNPYGHSLHFSSCCETVSFSRDGTKLYSKERDVTFYQTIIEPQAGMEHLAEQTYVCPNCAAIAHIGELLDIGCPYCGTRYIMSDLYPKVTNFYTLESMPDGEKWRRNPSPSRHRCGCHGGSFDATRQRTCPYCGAEYDSEREDWMVTGIVK